VAPADFVFFRTAVPGSAASIEAGIRWLAAAKPKCQSATLFVGSLDCVRHPTHLHEMLGDVSIRRLIDDGECVVEGRPVRLLTDVALTRQNTRLACEGPILAMWPTLRQLSLLAAKVGRSPVGVIVWSYDKDVAPLLETSDQEAEISNAVRRPSTASASR
jgi:hypothetical protein